MAATALREILAKFGVSFDDRELKKGDKAVDGVADKLAKLGAALAGGLVIKGIANFITGMTAQADALAKQSTQLGLSITQLQEWQYAAGLSGVSSEELTSALQRLQKSASDAVSGAGGSADAFRKLGIAVRNSSGQVKDADQLMTEVASAIGGIANPTERTAAAMNVFGRSGAKLIPLFNEGADGIAKLRAEAEELGGGFSPEFAKNAEAMNDSVDRLNFAWLSFKARLGGLVIPLVQRFMTQATKVTSSIVKWADKTGILGEKSNLAAAAAAVLGVAFFAAGIKAIAPWLPMLAMFAGLILLVDEFITLWKGGDTIIGRAIDKIFGEGSAQKAVEWAKGIVKSTRELFTDTERALNEFDGGLRLMWFDLTTWLDGQWKELGAGVKLVFFDIGNIANLVTASIKDAFAEMWNGILDGAGKALSKVSGLIEKIPGGAAIVGKLASSLASSRAVTDNRLNADTAAVGARAGILASGEQDQAAIAAQRAAIVERATVTVPSSTTVTDNSKIEINVPPGTSQQQVRQIADAVSKAKKPVLGKAAMNSLVKTAG